MISYDMEELIPIVAELVKQYTSNESTSVSYEKARQLMEAVIFCIQETDKQDIATSSVVERNMTVADHYQYGYQLVLQKVKSAMELYHSILPDFKYYRNLALHDTVRKGMPEFFRYYDAKFQPQNQILTLDYPTLISVDGFQGIDAIYCYLKFISLEQQFLGELSDDYIEECLIAYHEDYEELFINLPSIVLRHTITRMAGEEFEKIKAKEREQVEERLNEFLKILIHEKYHDDMLLYEYLKIDIKEFSYLIKVC